MIKKFNEFIQEGFLSKTLSRVKNNEERLEDKSAIKEACKLISEIISNYLNIEYSDDICTCDENLIKFVGTAGGYKLHFKFKKQDFIFNVGAPEDVNNFAEIILSWSTSFNMGTLYQKLSRSNEKVLEHVSDELMKIVKEKYLK